MRVWSYAFGAALMLVALCGCDARTKVQGRISGDDGRTVAGASVRLVDLKNGEAVQVTSGDDGSFAVARIHGVFAGPFHLVISKAGYTNVDREVRPKEEQTIDVVLPRAVGR